MNTQKRCIDSDENLFLEKTLLMHNVVMLFRSFLNNENKYYPQEFLGKTVI